MKTIALILACLPLFPAVSVAAQLAPWTIGERNGRSCFLTPEGKPFMMIGIFVLIHLIISAGRGTHPEAGFAGHYIDDVSLTMQRSPLR